MKQKHIFILFTLLLPYTVTISPATAVSTCIPLTPDDSCSFSFVSYGGPDWETSVHHKPAPPPAQHPTPLKQVPQLPTITTVGAK